MATTWPFGTRGVLPVALELRPDLVSFYAGANELLRPGMDLAGLAARYDDAVAQLTATGSAVVLFRAIERAGGTSRLTDRLCALGRPLPRPVDGPSPPWGVQR